MWLTWALGSAASEGAVFNCSSEDCENFKSFYFFFTVNRFPCCLILGQRPALSLLRSWGVGGWNHLCFSINPAVYLWRDLIGAFCWSYCCMINILCIFIIIQNVDISRPTEDALVTVPAHQWILCPDQLSNLGAVFILLLQNKLKN